VTVVPYDTPAAEIEKMRPDGIFLSNGPGDPEDVTEVISLIRQLRGKYPMFGICLGHQLIARAMGADTYKLYFGHRGGNHHTAGIGQKRRTEATCQEAQPHTPNLASGGRHCHIAPVCGHGHCICGGSKAQRVFN
jgi:carbamoyl-phosphate synthase small subunit